MSEVRLIDAEALKASLPEPDSNAQRWVYRTLCDFIDNAPTVEPTIKPICKVTFDKEQLQELVDKAIIRCQDCKHQKKYWHEDKRMKEKGYWIYGCDLIDDSFVGTPVSGVPDQFCSSAERKED